MDRIRARIRLLVRVIIRIRVRVRVRVRIGVRIGVGVREGGGVYLRKKQPRIEKPSVAEARSRWDSISS